MERIAIIVAGGSGTRMGGDTPKQFLPLAGKPVLVRTVERFVGVADRIVVVLPRGEMGRWAELSEQYGLHTEACQGGGTRFESVHGALRHLEIELVDREGKPVDVVAVHDGVRPLVSKALIERLFDEAARWGSAVPWVAAVDSFRFRGEAIDRAELRAVQTPQVFRAQSLAEAYEHAAHTKFSDDATVVEEGGGTLHFVEGERTNIKITTPEDLRIAEVLWR